MRAMIEIGDKMPDYLGVDQDGNECTRESMRRQKKFITTFIPKIIPADVPPSL